MASEASVYERIGRRAVEILSTASFAIQPPGSEKQLKKKTCKKGLSCNFTCIAANKTCRVGMTLEQQKAAAEVRKAARADKKEARKVTAPVVAQEPETKKPALDRIREAHTKAGLGTRDMELKMYAKTLDSLEALDSPTAAQKEHINALQATPDKHSSEAAMDRIDDLKRYHQKLFNGKQLSEDDLSDLPDTFAQGLRGGSAQAVTNTTALYMAEIYGKLPDGAKTELAKNWKSARGGKGLMESVETISGWKEASKPQEVKDFAKDFESRLKA